MPRSVKTSCPQHVTSATASHRNTRQAEMGVATALNARNSRRFSITMFRFTRLTARQGEKARAVWCDPQLPNRQFGAESALFHRISDRVRSGQSQFRPSGRDLARSIFVEVEEREVPVPVCEIHCRPDHFAFIAPDFPVARASLIDGQRLFIDVRLERSSRRIPRVSTHHKRGAEDIPLG